MIVGVGKGDGRGWSPQWPGYDGTVSVHVYVWQILEITDPKQIFVTSSYAEKEILKEY